MQKNWIHWGIISAGLLLAALPFRLPAQSDSTLFRVSSSFDERFPVLSPDGQTLYFVRDRHPNNLGFANLPDIWQSTRRPDGQWGQPMHLGLPVNNSKSNRLAGLSADEQTLYLTETDGNLSWLSLTRRYGRRWADPQAMFVERFVAGADAAFSVSPDEQILLIASRQTEGRGESDLYVAFRLEERRWSHPINLGASINTPGREAWAMIAADGQTLYLATDGHPGGAGGLDLWMSRRLDDSWQNWTTPVNLGPSINTPDDEWSLAMAGDGQTIILSRRDAMPQYELEKLELPPGLQPYPVAILSGRVLDGATGQPLFSEVFYRFSGPAEIAAKPLQLGPDASYRLIVPLNWGVELYGNPPGYLPLSERFPSAPSTDQLDSPNPQIAAWAGINAYYWQEEQVIHRIQEQLQRIQDELEALDKERRASRRKVAERTYDALESEDIRDAGPEVEALERRFNILRRSSSDTLSLSGPSFGGRSMSGEARKNIIEEANDEKTAQLRETLRTERPSADIPPSNAPLPELPPFLTFQELKQRAEKELTYEMLTRVQTELVQELFSPAWRSLQQGTSETLFNMLEEEEDSIRIHIRQRLGQFIMAPDAFDEYTGPDYEWLSRLKSDLKNVLRQPVRNHLRQSLRPFIFDVVRIELDFELKELIYDRQRQTLDFKIKQQQVIETSSDEVEQYLDQKPADLPATQPGMDTPLSFMETRKDLILLPVEEGRVLELKNVRFLPDGLDPAPGAEAELARLLRFLLENPKVIIQIRTHTHGWCDHIRAANLTEGRARLIAGYFIERGIQSARVRYVALGKTSPVADNATPAGRAANQRIELTILSTDN